METRLNRGWLFLLPITVAFLLLGLPLSTVAYSAGADPIDDTLLTLPPPILQSDSAWNKVSFTRTLGSPVRNLLNDCVDNQTIYAGTDSGLFVSYDSGYNWSSLFNRLSFTGQNPDLILTPASSNVLAVSITSTPDPVKEPTLNGKALALSCASPNLLMQGTSNGIVRWDLQSGEWHLLQTQNGFADGAQITTIVVAPDDPAVIFAGTWNQGVYKSIDRGMHWVSVNAGLSDLQVASIVISTTTPETVYVGTASGIYKSSITNVDWKISLSGSSKNFIVNNLLISPFDSDLIFATVYEKGNNSSWLPKGTYKSVDSGKSWLRSDEGLYTYGGAVLPQDGRNLVEQLVIDEADNTLYAVQAFTGMYKTADEGKGWIPCTHVPVGGGITSLLISDNDLLMGTTTGEIFISRDKCLSWSGVYVSLPSNAAITKLVTDTRSNAIYAGSYWGFFSSYDNGRTWNLNTNGMDDWSVGTLSIDQQDSSIMYVGTLGGSIYRSIDRGLTWQKIYTIRDLVDENTFPPATINDIFIYPNNNSILFASIGQYGLMKSTDQGQTWSRIDLPAGDKRIRGIISDAKYPGRLYVFTWGWGILRSDNLGQDWVIENQDLPAGFVTKLLFENGDLVAVLERDGIYKYSPDESPKWQFFRALPNPQSGAIIIIDPVNDNYYAGGSSGLYVSSGDSGWTFLSNQGLQTIPVLPPSNSSQSSGSSTNNTVGILSIAIDPAYPNLLYLGTSTGLYVGDIQKIALASRSPDIILRENFQSLVKSYGTYGLVVISTIFTLVLLFLCYKHWSNVLLLVYAIIRPNKAIDHLVAKKISPKTILKLSFIVFTIPIIISLFAIYLFDRSKLTYIPEFLSISKYFDFMSIFTSQVSSWLSPTFGDAFSSFLSIYITNLSVYLVFAVLFAFTLYFSIFLNGFLLYRVFRIILSDQYFEVLSVKYCLSQTLLGHVVAIFSGISLYIMLDVMVAWPSAVINVIVTSWAILSWATLNYFFIQHMTGLSWYFVLAILVSALIPPILLVEYFCTLALLVGELIRVLPWKKAIGSIRGMLFQPRREIRRIALESKDTISVANDLRLYLFLLALSIVPFLVIGLLLRSYSISIVDADYFGDIIGSIWDVWLTALVLSLFFELVNQWLNYALNRLPKPPYEIWMWAPSLKASLLIGISVDIAFRAIVIILSIITYFFPEGVIAGENIAYFVRQCCYLWKVILIGLLVFEYYRGFVSTLSIFAKQLFRKKQLLKLLYEAKAMTTRPQNLVTFFLRNNTSKFVLSLSILGSILMVMMSIFGHFAMKLLKPPVVTLGLISSLWLNSLIWEFGFLILGLVFPLVMGSFPIKPDEGTREKLNRLPTGFPFFSADDAPFAPILIASMVVVYALTQFVKLVGLAYSLIVGSSLPIQWLEANITPLIWLVATMWILLLILKPYYASIVQRIWTLSLSVVLPLIVILFLVGVLPLLLLWFALSRKFRDKELQTDQVIYALETRIWRHLGDIHCESDEQDQAINAYSQALESADRTGDHVRAINWLFDEFFNPGSNSSAANSKFLSVENDVYLSLVGLAKISPDISLNFISQKLVTSPGTDNSSDRQVDELKSASLRALQSIFDMDVNIVLSFIPHLINNGAGSLVFKDVSYFIEDEEISRPYLIMSAFTDPKAAYQAGPILEDAANTFARLDSRVNINELGVIYRLLLGAINARFVRDLISLHTEYTNLARFKNTQYVGMANVLQKLGLVTDLLIRSERLDFSERWPFYSKMVEILDNIIEDIEDLRLLPLEKDLIKNQIIPHWKNIFLEQIKILKGRAQVKILDVEAKRFAGRKRLQAIRLTVKNNGSGVAENIKTLLVRDNNEILLSDSQIIDSLAPQETTKLEFQYKSVIEQDHKVRFRLIYDDLEMKTLTEDFVFMLKSARRSKAFKNMGTIPYVVGPPLRPGSDMFVGRDEIFDFVLDNLEAKEQHNPILLYGERRIGKTSILHQFTKMLPDKYVGVFLDFQGINDPGDGAFLFDIAQTIRDRLGELGYSAPTLNQNDFIGTPFRFFKSVFLRQITELLGDRRLVLLIDEFNALDKRIESGKSSMDIFEHLRHIVSEQDIRFVFAGTYDIAKMAKNYWSFLFNIALAKEIKLLSEVEAGRLITQPVKGFFNYDPLAVERIWQVTAGHPYFVQLICRELVSNANAKQSDYITIQDVREIISKVIESGEIYLAHSYDDLPLNCKRLAVIIGILIRNQGVANPKEMLAFLQRLKLEIDLETTLNELMGRSIIEEKAGHYQFRIGLIGQWITANKSIESQIWA